MMHSMALSCSKGDSLYTRALGVCKGFLIRFFKIVAGIRDSCLDSVVNHFVLLTLVKQCPLVTAGDLPPFVKQDTV